MTHNKTYSYILPMLGNNINEFYNLEEAYIRDDKYPEYDTNYIFLKTKFTTSDYFARYTSSLREKPEYISDYISDNSKHLVTVYKLNDTEDIKNYNLFIVGKYSEFTEEYKKHIIKFHNLQPGNGISGVLYKLEYKYKQVENKLNYYDDGYPLVYVTIPRDQEISDPPYIVERETLKI